MTTYGRIPSLKDYTEMSKVWMPPHASRVFLVRIPNGWEMLTQENHIEQMVLRVSWMMQEWLQYHSNKQELESMLVETLKQLNPMQEPPNLLDEEDEEKPLGAWARNWGESLLEFNWTWQEWFRAANPEIQYPINLMEYQEPPDAKDFHDEFTIEEFLTEMRTPFI